MVGTFKANNPFNTFLLFIYGLILKLPFFIYQYRPVPKKSDGFLFVELLIKLKDIDQSAAIIYPLLTYLLLFTQAITFNKLINNQRLLQKNTYLPAMSYLLITSMFSEWNIFSAPVIINTLLIRVWAKMSSLYKSNKPKTILFNIGIIIGISAFFYFPSVAFALLIVFALIVTRPFKIAEWIVAFMGILTPYYFLFSYLFLSDKINTYQLPAFFITNPVFKKNYWTIIAITLIVVAFVIGLYYIQINLRKQLAHIRKSWNLILLYLLVAFFVPFINGTTQFEYWILIAVPLSACISSAFLYFPKKWMALLLHWLMLACAIVITYIK